MQKSEAMKSVFVGCRWYDLCDIARMCDLSVEELAHCSYAELQEIVLDYLND